MYAAAVTRLLPRIPQGRYYGCRAGPENDDGPVADGGGDLCPGRIFGNRPAAVSVFPRGITLR